MADQYEVLRQRAIKFLTAYGVRTTDTVENARLLGPQDKADMARLCTESAKRIGVMKGCMLIDYLNLGIFVLCRAGPKNYTEAHRELVAVNKDVGNFSTIQPKMRVGEAILTDVDAAIATKGTEMNQNKWKKFADRIIGNKFIKEPKEHAAGGATKSALFIKCETLESKVSDAEKKIADYEKRLAELEAFMRAQKPLPPLPAIPKEDTWQKIQERKAQCEREGKSYDPFA